MLIIRQKFIYRVDIKANPAILYIFGDNLQRYGFGGQAKEMRGEPNAFGIATKRTPAHNYYEDYFHDGQHDAIEIIENEFKRLLEEVHRYHAVVIPLDGIGTGLSKLQIYAPKLLEHIDEKLEGLKNL